METVFYVNIPVVIISLYESLNLVKVRSAESDKVYYVDRKFLKDCPQKVEPTLSIAQLRGR